MLGRRAEMHTRQPAVQGLLRKWSSQNQPQPDLKGWEFSQPDLNGWEFSQPDLNSWDESCQAPNFLTGLTFCHLYRLWNSHTMPIIRQTGFWCHGRPWHQVSAWHIWVLSKRWCYQRTPRQSSMFGSDSEICNAGRDGELSLLSWSNRDLTEIRQVNFRGNTTLQDKQFKMVGHAFEQRNPGFETPLPRSVSRFR